MNKNLIISLLIMSSTVVGGLCLFGHCAFGDAGFIAEPDGTIASFENYNDAGNDIPIVETVLKDDGLLEGKVLQVQKPEIKFPSKIGLTASRTDSALDSLVKDNKAQTQAKTASNQKANTNKASTSKTSDEEMKKMLAEIKRQESEMKKLAAELQAYKEKEISVKAKSEVASAPKQKVKKSELNLSNNQLAKNIVKENKKEIEKANKLAKKESSEKEYISKDELKLAIAKAVSEELEKKEQTALTALSNTDLIETGKAGEVKVNKNSTTALNSVNNTSLNGKSKRPPMIVESTRKKTDKTNKVALKEDSVFKDYSNEPIENSITVSDDDEAYDINTNAFAEAFSALRPQKKKKQTVLEEKRKVASNGISKEDIRNFRNAYASSDAVKRDFYNTYISENRYLSPFEGEDENGESKSALSENQSGSGYSGKKDHEILQLKVEFLENSAALSSADINILRYFVYTAQNDPTKGVQITIGKAVMNDVRQKKLAARRLAMVSAIFREEGLVEDQIIPILTDRDTESFAFSIIPIDKFENYQKNEGKDMFGDTINSQSFRTMKW